MEGLMMHRPLRIADILTHAAQVYPGEGIVSARTEGDIHRQSYPETAARVARLAHALRALGIKPGDRVATLAWNGYRHFELYYAISGIGAVCHTINPRLSAEQMGYIVNHAGDSLLFFDTTFLPIIEGLAPHFPESLRYVAMVDEDKQPESKVECLNYEALLKGQPERFDWPEFDETTAAALCYTSGTTGNPKGTLYSHRSTVLHALCTAISLPKVLQEGSRILPVVPLFHVNAWGLPYSAPLTGASLIMPGPGLDGASLFKLMDGEQVFSAWGVPTVWLGLQKEIEAQGRLPEGFGHLVVGGSAAPRAMIEGFETRGVDVCHAWGMTEMSPIGTVGNLSPAMRDKPLAEQLDVKQKQGRRAFGIDMKIVDEDGTEQPQDGKATGELFVRGNTIAAGYFNNAEASAEAIDAEGWFGTGDIARITPDGTLSITDRTKDLIKSGGEWISSIDMENVVMGHPQVTNCAAIAVPHEKWGERPMLVVVPKGDAPDPEALRELLAPHFASWQLPDEVLFVEELPLTATGKVSKLTLRRKYAAAE
ncbi:long-chain fatty acid--CoA ligase [Vannielia litorea]|uniref:long-chain fatty acid--CoA ligase n=1 Tax=Vannielia litorea TaxID=1217970 RepID=UPI001C97A2CC|nr:long-chain fatty acid--CoA ligase [Vannielia litorea]MBY6047829.1 long-chain fatty acid--CoA ligase [Vannielia litorea]MBY6075243.1 long-chain fatty acid--CoA ligase [Vannielia litorea]